MEFDTAQINAAIAEGMKYSMLMGAVIGAASTKFVDLLQGLYWHWAARRRWQRRQRRLGLAS